MTFGISPSLINDIERQRKIEADAYHDGLLRYVQDRQYQSATDSKPVRQFMGNLLKAVSDGILAEQRALKKAQGQKLPKYGLPLLSLTPDKLALITVGTLLNAIISSEFEDGSPPPATPLGYDIGQVCRKERLFDCLQNRQIDVARELSPRNRSRNAARRADELARKLDDDDDWAKNYRSYHLGEKLIALAIRFAQFEGQPVFELKTVRETDAGGTKTSQRIALTTAAADWIDAHQPDLASLAIPVYQPMIIPPRPWTSLSEGGYLITPLTLLKRRPNRRAQQFLESADLTLVRSAVNALQNSAFRINKDVYGIMRSASDAGHLSFGSKTHMALRLSRAERLLHEPRFYFPHQLDHRGRAYPVPQLINPQSDDIGRSLLEFADGKPLGERGPYWLAIQIANCFGKNKLSFDERRAWVEQHEEEIVAFANDPLRPHRFRDEADKPWMFLAACQEWKRYKEEGPDFRSHLPVSMDGTCNGYQHLSALGRDPIGGRATNLVFADKPQDIYQDVCDEANARIARDAESDGREARGRAERKRDSAQPQEKAEASNGEARGRQAEDSNDDRDAARQLLGKIDRDDAKHATMTTPYGVTRGTIYKALLKRPVIKSCTDPKKCARYLARVLEESIPRVAVEAGRIMKWLRQVARILAKANRGMAWTTPAGFCVVHETRQPKPIRVATADRTLLIYEEDETRKIDPRKLADGAVAHLVHSLDAAHMMRTIVRLVAAGICHFMMVHDSFGVHACDIDLLHRVLREEFVAIYSEPVLQNFLNELRKAHPHLDFPDLPPTGNLDIRQVTSSPYFFA